MPFTTEDARTNMNDLISRLDEKSKQLSDFIDDNEPDLSSQQIAELELKIAKLDMEIEHRTKTAAFDAASTSIIRPPTETEIVALQNTLEFMGKEINTIATFSAVIKFSEDVMTKNAQRFVDILKTISI
jgi:hypothetical protein